MPDIADVLGSIVVRADSQGKLSVQITLNGKGVQAGLREQFSRAAKAFMAEFAKTEALSMLSAVGSCKELDEAFEHMHKTDSFVEVRRPAGGSEESKN